jgi:catechol 2,3-dioxygenase
MTGSPAGERLLVPPATRLGPIHLSVTDPDRNLTVWRDLIGLQVVRRDEGAVHLGVGEQTLVVLYGSAARPAAEGFAGLYHVAIHVPTRADLARIILRLYSSNYPNYPTDHLATETTYLSDLDGNGIEITFETPERGRLTMAPNGQPAAQDVQGNFVPPTVGLDVQRVVRVLGTSPEITTPLGAGTKVGHVHLRVSDLEAALRFYRDVIGFEQQWYGPSIGMADVNLPDYVPHVIAINTWTSRGAPQAPAGSAGLRHYSIVLPAEADRAALRKRLAAASAPIEMRAGVLRTADPAGNQIHVLVAD